MGFKKTEKGNLIYEFDFVPTKLVPMSSEEIGLRSCYAVEGPNGERAPIYVEFQGERHADNGLAVCHVRKDEKEKLGDSLCFTFNIQVVAACIMLLNRKYGDYYPWGTNSMSSKGVVFTMPTLDEAKSIMTESRLPKDNYEKARSV